MPGMLESKSLLFRLARSSMKIPTLIEQEQHDNHKINVNCFATVQSSFTTNLISLKGLCFEMKLVKG